MPRFAVPVLLGLATLALPAAAHAQDGNGVTAPAYPGNTIRIERPASLVAGRIESVRLSGRSVFKDAYDTHSVSMYVQNADADPQCAPYYSGQLDRSINIRSLNASASPTGFVMSDSYRISPQPPSAEVVWATTSTQFAIKPGISRVLLCAYVRYVTDDVAGFGIPVDVSQPSCTAPSLVRRGLSVSLRCNISGKATVRFTRGGRTIRTKTVQISTKDGRAKASTLGLARGTYKVTTKIGQLQMGSARTVRVR